MHTFSLANSPSRFYVITAVVTCLFISLLIAFYSTGVAAALVLGGAVAIIGMVRFEALIHAMIILLPLQSALPVSLKSFGVLNPFNLLAVAMTSVWLVNAILKRRRLIQSSWMNIVLLFFVLACLGALVNSAATIGSWFMFEQLNPLKRWLSPILLFFPIANSNLDRPAIKRLLMTTIAMTLVITLMTVWDLNAYGFHNINYGTRFGGPFGIGGENDLAAFFVFYPVIALAIALNHKNLIMKAVLGGVFALSLIPLIFSLSRGAYLGLVAVILFLSVVRFRWMLPFIIVAAVTYEAWAPGIVQTRVEATTVTSNELVGGRVPAPDEMERGLETSSAQRIRIWRGGWRIIQDRPIVGMGYNTFRYTVPKYANMEWGMDAHNMYLRVGAEMGVSGLIIFLLLLLVPFGAMAHVYRTTGNRLIQGWMLGGMACIVGIFVVNVFGSRFVREELVGLYWVNVALTFAYIFLRRRRLFSKQ